jgi:hypothetical protein
MVGPPQPYYGYPPPPNFYVNAQVPQPQTQLQFSSVQQQPAIPTLVPAPDASIIAVDTASIIQFAANVLTCDVVYGSRQQRVELKALRAAAEKHDVSVAEELHADASATLHLRHKMNSEGYQGRLRDSLRAWHEHDPQGRRPLIMQHIVLKPSQKLVMQTVVRLCNELGLVPAVGQPQPLWATSSKVMVVFSPPGAVPNAPDPAAPGLTTAQMLLLRFTMNHAAPEAVTTPIITALSTAVLPSAAWAAAAQYIRQRAPAHCTFVIIGELPHLEYKPLAGPADAAPAPQLGSTQQPMGEQAGMLLHAIMNNLDNSKGLRHPQHTLAPEHFPPACHGAIAAQIQRYNHTALSNVWELQQRFGQFILSRTTKSIFLGVKAELSATRGPFTFGFPVDTGNAELIELVRGYAAGEGWRVDVRYEGKQQRNVCFVAGHGKPRPVGLSPQAAPVAAVAPAAATAPPPFRPPATTVGDSAPAYTTADVERERAAARRMYDQLMPGQATVARGWTSRSKPGVGPFYVNHLDRVVVASRSYVQGSHAPRAEQSGNLDAEGKRARSSVDQAVTEGSRRDRAQQARALADGNQDAEGKRPRSSVDQEMTEGSRRDLAWQVQARNSSGCRNPPGGGAGGSEW